jgi:hypothetical protein
MEQHLQRSPSASSIHLLKKIQSGLASILSDEDRSIKHVTSIAEHQGLLSDVSTPLAPVPPHLLIRIRLLLCGKLPPTS